MRSSAKKVRGRPRGRRTPHRPVLSVRVPAELYEKIQESARRAHRTVSEEAVWSIEQGFALLATIEDATAHRERAFADANAILAAADRFASVDIEQLLERAATRALQKQKETQS